MIVKVEQIDYYANDLIRNCLLAPKEMAGDFGVIS